MQQFVNGITVGSIYVLFALGLTLSWGALNVLNLAHGAVFAFAGFSAYLLTDAVALPFVVLVPFAMLVGGTLTVLFDAVIFRAIRRRSSDPHQAEILMVIASVGAAGGLLTIIRNRTHDTPFSVAAESFSVSTYEVAGVRISNIQIVIVVLGVGLATLLAVWVARSRNGRALRALAYDPETCGLMGVNSSRLYAITMFIAGALAGLAGILLIVYLGAIGADTGDQLLVKGFAAIVLGGVGSVWGTVAAAFIVALGETAVIATTSGTWTSAVAFGVIIVVILVRPQGLLSRGKVERV